MQSQRFLALYHHTVRILRLCLSLFFSEREKEIKRKEREKERDFFSAREREKGRTIRDKDSQREQE